MDRISLFSFLSLVLTPFSLADLTYSLDLPGATWLPVGYGIWNTSSTSNPIIQRPGDLTGYAYSFLIVDSQMTGILSTVLGPTLLSWFWQVSSEANRDFLSLSIDAVSNYKQSISGNVSSWTYATQCVLPGVHNFSFVYQKDASGAAGLDRGFVDYVFAE